MAKYKNQTPTFYQIYVNSEGKETFSEYERVKKTEKNEAGEDVNTFEVVKNKEAKFNDGSSKVKPMNRHSRRLLDRQRRLK